MEELQHPKRLFDFLACYGVTHADIATHLGVSVASASSWSVGRRRMPLPHYKQLLDYAVKTSLGAYGLHPDFPVDLATKRRLLADFRRLRALYEEQRHIQEAAYRDIKQTCRLLARLVAKTPPETWTVDYAQLVKETAHQFNGKVQDAVTQQLIPQVNMVAGYDKLIQCLEELIHAEEAREAREEPCRVVPAQETSKPM
jgi:hypothetical protein